MYTKKQVDEMLSQVEIELEKTLGSITKNENIEAEEEAEEEVEEVITKSEEEAEEESEGENYETIDELYASMNKSEKEAHYDSIKKALFGEIKEEKISKSESNLVEENEELKKNIETLNELVGKLFNTKKAPAQKSITGANFIAKSEENEIGNNSEDFSEMSKAEITSKLKAVDFTELKKADRNAINDFYLKNGSVDSIKHLISK